MTRDQPRPTPPEGAKAAGKHLWAEILAQFDLNQAELVVLREMTRVVDRLDDLDAAVREGGAVLADGKIAPALVESRQQQIVLAKLSTALRIPTDVSGGSVSDAAREVASARWKRGRRGA